MRGNLQRCFDTFKKYVLDVFTKNGYSVDIYIHTWNFGEINSAGYTGKYYKDNSIEQKIKIFSPKDYCIEDFKLFKIPQEMIGLKTKTGSGNCPKEFGIEMFLIDTVYIK